MGVDRVRITVDNGFGTSSELVTVKYLDLLSPVIEPVTLDCKQNVDINWLPTGKFLMLGSGDRIRHVEWSAINLPDGIHLDTETGRLTGKISAYGNYESYLSVSTNCGTATCKLLWAVAPARILTLSNPSCRTVYFNPNATQCLELVWCVSPQGGKVQYASQTRYMYVHYRDVYNSKSGGRSFGSATYKETGPIRMSFLRTEDVGLDCCKIYFTLSVPAGENAQGHPGCRTYTASFGTASYTYCGIRASINFTVSIGYFKGSTSKTRVTTYSVGS